MSNPLNITDEEAQNIVLAQSARTGYMPPELLTSENPETQQVLVYHRSLRETFSESFGDLIDIIIQEISARRGRFILELIQNVEDCDFDLSNVTPSIGFVVNPQRIVVESNQNGFTAEDVAQICHTGNSWKRGRRGYVGEKGIGFKSVFQVASKVEIQSNAFSFHFEYNGGQSSTEKLGIVTPIVGSDLIPDLERPLTRMTLTKHERTPYLDIVLDFQAIPHTLLLFLTKIKEIRLSIYLPDEERTKSTITRISHDEDNTTRISELEGESDRVDEWSYHVFKTDIKELPNEPARVDINECEGLLGFPIDQEGRPRTYRGHDVYAFLPVCTVGFKFLIQADFLLQASREEVLSQSPWNIEILNQLAYAFCDAVSEFCSRPSLRFSWVKFLPVSEAVNLTPLWQNFSALVIERLRGQRIVYAHAETEIPIEETSFLRPHQVCILPPEALDAAGLPLFADLSGRNTRYVSLKYAQEDCQMLQTSFQIPDINDIQMLERIREDLRRPNSKMKDQGTEEDWHSRAADLIQNIWNRSPACRATIERECDLIPLSNGTWASSSIGNLCLPSQDGPMIPSDLVLTVSLAASRNPSRRRLFELLGISDIQPTSVVNNLLLLYARNETEPSLEMSKMHLSYLYWHLEDARDARLSYVWVYAQDLSRAFPEPVPLYLPSDDEYGARQLLGAVPRPDDPARYSPRFSVPYLNIGYLDSFPLQTRRHGQSWRAWLESALKIRRTLRMTVLGGPFLCGEFQHFLANRPDKIVGLLRTQWAIYSREMSDRITGVISRANVICQDGSLARLSSTYLPLPDLIQRAQNLAIPPNFHFLFLHQIAEEEILLEDWIFLARFGVKFEANLSFYLDILGHHATYQHEFWNVQTRIGVLAVYAWISDHCNEINRPWIIATFQRDRRILHPESMQIESDRATWLSLQDCVWRGPANNLLDKIPLASVAAYRDNPSVVRLFCDILGIQNANWMNYRDKLLQMRRGLGFQPNSFENVQELYILLSREILSEENWDSLLTTFEMEGLVFNPSLSRWVSPSACLWSSPIPIPGYLILSELYINQLVEFFQEHLAIQPATIDTMVEGLLSLVNEESTMESVKQVIIAIGEMNPIRDDLISIHNIRVLPIRTVRNGSVVVSLCAPTSDFVVIDRIKLGSIFEGHAEILDFSLEEVRQLNSFLLALDLDGRYVSRLCTVETTCNSEGTLDTVGTEKFEERAFYLLRCAFSYRSPLVQGDPLRLYNRLAATTIRRSTEISANYTIRLPNGHLIGPISQDHSNLHIREEDSGWTIFVPHNRQVMEACYMRDLPHALAKLFMIPDFAIENIGHVLNSRLTVVDDLLEDGGVGNIPNFEPPPRIIREIERLSIDSDDDLDDPDVNREERRRRGLQDTPSSSREGSAEPSSADSSRSVILDQGPIEENRFLIPNAYRELLNNVIRIARTATMPRLNEIAAPANDNAHPGFNHNTAFGLRSQGQFNHDMKIGAAGELFVFEFFKTLNLPSFDFENWTSTIRRQALVHPNYQAMGAWAGRRETADLRYQDTESILTQNLIDTGYLNADIWNRATPEYLIEVKTTTGELGDRFFMSNSQVQLMETTALIAGQTSDRVYVIFRVYNLGRESLGFRIYLDPQAHRGRSLAFAEHSWTVTAV